MSNQLAQNIKLLRTEAGLTQQQVAEAIKLDRSTYSYYEIGRTRPDIYTLVKIAKLFRISCDDLLGYEPVLPKATASKGVRSKAPVYSRMVSGMAVSDLDTNEQNLILIYRQLNADNISELCEHAKKLLNDQLISEL